MEKQTQNIIFRIEYSKNLKQITGSIDKKALRLCKWHRNKNTSLKGYKTTNNIINYFTRDDACDKSTTSLNTSEELSGLFGKNGDLSIEEKKKLIKKLENTESNIWDGVLSFDGLIEATINNRVIASEVLKANINNLFKYNGLNKDNMEWYGVFHNNTKNRHIHFIFLEKEPKNINKNGQLVYRNKGKLSENSLSSFMQDIYVWTMKNENQEYLNRKRELTDALINKIDNKDILNLAMDLSSKICSDKNITYNKLSKYYKKKVDNFADLLLVNNLNCQKKYDEFLINLNQLNEEGKLLDPEGKSIKMAKFKENSIKEFHKDIGSQIIELLKLADNHKELNESLFKEKYYSSTNKNSKKIISTSSNTIRHNSIERKESQQKFNKALREIEQAMINYPYGDKGYVSLEESLLEEKFGGTNNG